MKLTYEQIDELISNMEAGDEVSITEDPQNSAISCLIQFEGDEEPLILLISEDGDLL